MNGVILDIQHLLEVGGNVLVTLFFVAIALWTLIVERFFYLRLVHPRRADGIAHEWDDMEDKGSWDAQAIRRLWISELVMAMNEGLPMIRALISVCPLLGLLGTTTGMVEVYEVMAIEGNSEPRQMAAGVSQAMVTTMAGLIIALSGIFFSFRLEGDLIEEYERLDSRLHIDEDLLGHHHRVRSAKAKERTRRANERRRRHLAQGAGTADMSLENDEGTVTAG